MNAIQRKFVVAILAIAAAVSPAGAELAGSVAPDFVLRGVNGKNYRLSEYRGHVVLVSFWASWCGDCRSQLRAIDSLYASYSGSGLEMLAVSLDSELDAAGDTVRALGLDLPALHDAAGAVGRQYEVRRMPYVVLIDRDGVVREAFTGFRKGEESRYLDEVRALLNE